MSSQPSEAFGLLEQQATTFGNLRIVSVGLEAEGSDVKAAIDYAGRRLLLVPSRITPDKAMTWRGSSLELSFVPLTSQSNSDYHYVLRCLDIQLNQTFALLSDEVIEALKMDPEDSTRAISETLARWESLLGRPQGAEMTIPQLAGLFAELSALIEVVDALGPRGLRSWSGPSGSRHDFLFESTALEVKATVTGSSSKVTIHGLSQLEAPAGSDLYLRHYQLELAPAGVTIHDCVEDLISRGVDAKSLSDKLQDVGYARSEGQILDRTKFKVIGSRTYEVTKDFPRITTSTLCHPGHAELIENVEYSLNLSSLPEKKIHFSLLTLDRWSS